MRTSPAPASTSSRGAFTLAEILVVLVIVSIGFGMVAFSLSAGRPALALDREAERLANWIRAATSHAAERAEPCTVVYDLELGRLEVGPGIASHSVGGGVRIECVVVVGEEVLTVEEGKARALVFAGGTCQPHLVTVGQQGVGARTLEVCPVTGDVTILEGRRNYERIDLGGLFAARQGK